MHGVARFRRFESAGGGAHVPGDFWADGGRGEVPFQVGVEVSEGQEEFDEGFLEDEAAGGTPAVGGVRGGEAVDGGLGGDSPVGFLLRECE